MKLLILNVVICGLLGTSHAQETLTEKGKAAVDTTTRTVKKGLNRTQEALCSKLTGDNQIQCLAKEAKNRTTELKDTIVDKAIKKKNQIDNN